MLKEESKMNMVCENLVFRYAKVGGDIGGYATPRARTSSSVRNTMAPVVIKKTALRIPGRA